MRDSQEQFIQASIFACFISVLNLVIRLPVYRLIHVGVESTSFLLVDTVFTYAFWFIEGSIFHAAAKLFGGHAHYRKSVITYLYLTAFQPLLCLLGIPFTVVVERRMIEGMYPLTDESLVRLLQEVLERPAVVVSSVLTLSAIVYYFVASVTAFRTVHHLGRLRGFWIVFFGELGCWALAAGVKIPLTQSLSEAFKTGTN